MIKREKSHLLLVCFIGLITFFYQNCLRQGHLSSEKMGGNGDGYLGMQYIALAPDSQCGKEPSIHGAYEGSNLTIFPNSNGAVLSDPCNTQAQDISVNDLYHFEEPDIYVHNATIFSRGTEVDIEHPLIIGLCIPDAPPTPTSVSPAPPMQEPSASIPSLIIRASKANDQSLGFKELVAQAISRNGDQKVVVGQKIQITSAVSEEEILFDPLLPQSDAVVPNPDDELILPKQLRVNIAADPDHLIDGHHRVTHAGSLILTNDQAIPVHCFRSSWALRLLSETPAE